MKGRNLVVDGSRGFSRPVSVLLLKFLLLASIQLVLSGCSSPEPTSRQRLARVLSLDSMLAEATIDIAPRLEPVKRQRVRFELVEVGDVWRPAIFHHPPATLTFSGLELGEQPRFRFSLAIREEAWKKGSNGARFEARIRDDGVEEVIFDAFLDPAQNEEQRGWVDHEISLEAWTGKTVDLVLVTGPGPDGIENHDHSFWGEPTIVSERQDDEVLPNVILISLDTMRADHLGVYGYPGPISPNIDALAARGTVFRQAISQSSWTRPGHLAMLASLYPDRRVLYYDEEYCPIRPEVTTVTEVLADRGYLTAAFTGGGYVNNTSGFEQGFDVFRSYGRRLEDGIEPILDWLDDYSESRFFLFLHNYNVHRPYDPPPEFFDLWVDHTPELCEGITFSADDARSQRWKPCLIGPGGLDYLKALYAAEAAYLDHLVGRVITRLEELGVLEDSILIITSDHGEEHYEHGRSDHIKTVFQELIHVPLIVVGPGIPAGATVAPAVEVLDIPPTILDLLGFEKSPEFQGRSLVPAFRGERLVAEHAFSASAWEPDFGFRRDLPHNFTSAVVWEEMKAIRNLGNDQDKAELYDLTADPFEQAGRVMEVGERGELHGVLERWLRTLPTEEQCAPAEMDAETTAQLRALGYID